MDYIWGMRQGKDLKMTLKIFDLRNWMVIVTEMESTVRGTYFSVEIGIEPSIMDMIAGNTV